MCSSSSTTSPLRRSSRIRNKCISQEVQSLCQELVPASKNLVGASSSSAKRRRDDDDDTSHKAAGHEPAKKRAKTVAKVRRRSYGRDGGKGASAASRLNSDIWAVIISHCTPSVVRKVYGLSKDFQALISAYRQSLLVESRFQTYGLGREALPKGMSEWLFGILLEGKGCMRCGNPRVTATYWVWGWRWCVGCWRENMMSEPEVRRFLAYRGVPPPFDDQIIDSLPWGVRDSWKSPHALVEEAELRFSRGLVKTFSMKEVETLCDDFDALIPDVPLRTEGMTAAQHLALMQQYRRDADLVPMRMEAFFGQRLANANMIMEKALIIDKAVRAKSQKDKELKQRNRKARARYFTDRAEVDLHDVPAECVQRSDFFLAAIKIGTDAGTPRAWAILKAKIRKEWDEVYHECMKEVMWDRDAYQKEQKRLEALAVYEMYAAVEESLVDEDEHVEGEKPCEKEEEEEEEADIEPYSIWKDRDLTWEAYRYTRSIVERTAEANESSNGPARSTTVYFDTSARKNLKEIA